MSFEKFPKIPRLSRGFQVSEKIDGTNAQIHIVGAYAEEYADQQPPIASAVAVQHPGTEKKLVMYAGSRNRYVSQDDDNFGFAQWVYDNAEELFKLGPGRHYGEWFGPGIQKNPLGVSERRLAMFNPRWEDQGPECVEVVPQLGRWAFVDLARLCGTVRQVSSYVGGAAEGARPEGLMFFHEGSRQIYKWTIENDEGKHSA